MTNENDDPVVLPSGLVLEAVTESASHREQVRATTKGYARWPTMPHGS